MASKEAGRAVTEHEVEFEDGRQAAQGLLARRMEAEAEAQRGVTAAEEKLKQANAVRTTARANARFAWRKWGREYDLPRPVWADGTQPDCALDPPQEALFGEEPIGEPEPAAVGDV